MILTIKALYLLKLDNISEATQYQLKYVSFDEARSILCSRVDFSPEVVRRIRLIGEPEETSIDRTPDKKSTKQENLLDSPTPTKEGPSLTAKVSQSVFMGVGIAKNSLGFAASFLGTIGEGHEKQNQNVVDI